MSTQIDKTKELETRNIKELLWIYALPAVISQIIASVYNIVDRIFIGQGVGALAIAGLAITFPIMNIIHAFGSLVGAGSSARLSIVLGRKDIDWAEKIVGNSMILTIILGIGFTTCGYLFMDDILQAFGATTETIAYAREYMYIVLPGMFMTTVTFNLCGLIRASGYPVKAMWILAGGAILNIILDPIFIFIFDWGIAGAAWATTISMTIGGLVSLAHFIDRKSFIRFRRHAWKPRLYIFRNIMLIGVSPFSMNLASAGVVALLNAQLIRYGGDLAVGAYGIVNSYVNFLFLFILGICQGMQPIAGYNYGAGRNERLKEIFTLTLRVTIIIGFVGALIAVLLPGTMARIFSSDEALVAMATPAMRLLMVMFPFIAFTVTNSNFFQSIDKPWISIVVSLSRQLLFLLPMIYIMPNIFENFGWKGLNGIWSSCTICDVLGAILAAIFLYSQRKVFNPNYKAPDRKPIQEMGPND
ncbi:MAG: MATE family efflux transporter [Bacteroidales bacterium]|nr:MATE family efflux transporter [Bacteroidales bacterium]